MIARNTSVHSFSLFCFRDSRNDLLRLFWFSINSKCLFGGKESLSINISLNQLLGVDAGAVVDDGGTWAERSRA